MAAARLCTGLVSILALLACGGATDPSSSVASTGSDDRSKPGSCEQDKADVAGEPAEQASCNSNLLEGDLGERSNWMGGDSRCTSDDPCGIQGPIYAYGDEASATAAGLSPSCSIPDDPLRTIACNQGRCCISGQTVVDRTHAAWGCGIGFGLRHSHDGSRFPYASPGVVGFRFTIEGTLTTGQTLRVHYQQPGASEGACSPFIPIIIDAGALAGGSHEGIARFEEATCPTRGWEDCACLPASSTPMDLQFQVTGGGNAAGPYTVCVTELTPLLEETRQ